MSDVRGNAGQEVHQSHPEQSQPERGDDERPKGSQETIVVLAEDLVGGSVGVLEFEVGCVDAG